MEIKTWTAEQIHRDGLKIRPKLTREEYFKTKYVSIEEMNDKIYCVIENIIDHYTPYRPITDSSEAKEIRKVLANLLEELKFDTALF